MKLPTGLEEVRETDDNQDLSCFPHSDDMTTSTESEEYTIGTFSWIKQSADGVANFLQKSAAAIVNELSKLEDDFEAEERGSVLPLPWELIDENQPTLCHEDLELKVAILHLSQQDETFLGPYSVFHREHDHPDFVLDDSHIDLIHRLLLIDKTLSKAHARLSGRSHICEDILWQNYFHHCEERKRQHLAAISRPSLSDSEDGDSLIPVDSDSEHESMSYIAIESPPASMGMQSVDSMVLIHN